MKALSNSTWRNVFQPAVDLWRNWRERQHRVSEFDALDSNEVAVLAKELGVTPLELRTLSLHDEHAADLLYRRMAELKINPATVNPAVMRDLQRCCSNCESKEICVHEIEDKPQAASWPKYCPNKETLEALMTTKMPCCH